MFDKQSQKPKPEPAMFTIIEDYFYCDIDHLPTTTSVAIYVQPNLFKSLLSRIPFLAKKYS